MRIVIDVVVIIIIIITTKDVNRTCRNGDTTTEPRSNRYLLIIYQSNGRSSGDLLCRDHRPCG